MPFTITHILAVTPFALFIRHHRPLSALVIGSMVPDFPLFFPVGLHYQTTHSLLGIFTVCLPLGFALYWIFHVVMSGPLFELLGPYLRRKFASAMEKPRVPPFRQSIIIGACLCLGALTHGVWDAFTHDGQWGVKLVPALSEVVFRLEGQDWRGFKVFQHGSSVIGLPLLLGLTIYWIVRMPSQSMSASMIPNALRRGLLSFFILFPILLGIAVAPALASPNSSTERLLFHFVTVDLSTFLILLLLYSLTFHAYRFIADREAKLPGKTD